MNIVLIIVIIISTSMQSVFKKAFSEKTSGSGAYFFSAFTSFAALLFFVLTANGLFFDTAVIPYSIGFGLAYAIGTVFGVLAIANGSLALTSLLTSFSLMIPTLYGLLFLNDPISFGLFPGIILLIISLILVNKTSKEERITLRWFVYIFLSFAGNGMCSVIQKMQQVAFEGAYKNEMMIMALIFVVISVGLVSLFEERKQIVTYAKKGWILGAICGVMNGIVNLFVMILSAKMPVSIMFPMISAGGLIITYIVSKLVYKENLSKRQIVGFVLGTLSIIFLSI